MTVFNLELFINKGQFDIKESIEFGIEISNYITSIESAKTSVNIVGVDDKITLSRSDLIKLLNHYLDGNLYEWDLEYICSFIEFHYCDDDEKINKVLFNFSDPYLGYEINKKNVEKTILFLSNNINELELVERKNCKLREGYRSVFK